MISRFTFVLKLESIKLLPSILAELHFGHLCYHLTDVLLQPISPPDTVFSADWQLSQASEWLLHRQPFKLEAVAQTAMERNTGLPLHHRISKESIGISLVQTLR